MTYLRVDSDDDVRDISELDGYDNEDETINPRGSQKSIVQQTLDGVKLSNAILLSGPHGAGKTAAAQKHTIVLVLSSAVMISTFSEEPLYVNVTSCRVREPDEI